MTPRYTYSEFKRKLGANPKWIVRALFVIRNEFPVSLLDQYGETRAAFVEKFNGEYIAAEDGQSAKEFVLRFAPSLYRFYVKNYKVPK
jgi:hypothetical protein